MVSASNQPVKIRTGKLAPRFLWSMIMAVAALAFITPCKLVAATSPSITIQPQNRTNLLGTNATFTVTAIGTAPLFYRWSFNGTNLTNSAHIGGATNTTLTISNVVAGDTGNYRVGVTNSHGGVVSSNATLTVLIPAAIAGQPTNQSVVLNSNAIFAATAIGTAPLNYHWYFNGSPLSDGGRVSGSATTNLSIATVQTNDAGPYQLVVTNNYGSATSAVATLTVLLPPGIVTSPTNQRVLQGGSVSFSVLAAGTQPLCYQWQKDGVDLADGDHISGTTNATLTVSNLQFSDAGQYRAVVTNAYGTATSAAATLAVATNLPPLSGSIGVWGDYDNDGLMDVLLAGTVQGVPGIPDGRFTRLYHNAGGGIFDDTGVALPQLDNVSAAWGDFDNDGDLDLVLGGLADGTNGPVSVTEVYRNDGSNHFTQLNLGLEPVAEGSVMWVDYDNDGRLDIFETGYDTTTSNWVTQLYHNNGDGTFTLAVTNLPAPQNARGYWGDCDNDGYADLVLSGSGTPQLIHNNGSGNFVNTGFGFIGGSSIVSGWGDADGNGGLDLFSSDCFPCPPPRLYLNDGTGGLSGTLQSSINMWAAAAAWGDVDNSGRACVLINGWVPIQQGVWGFAMNAYINVGGSWQQALGLGGRTDGSATWVDYDGDGALDVFYTGQQFTGFWHNNLASHRDYPQPPLSPSVAFTGLDGVMFSWLSPSNTPLTGRGLSYNVRVGRAPGGVDVVSPMADPVTGWRLIPALGNASAAHLFTLTNLPPGNYYWAVQSIGQSFTGSPFTTEGVFTVTSSPPIVVTQPTNQSVLSGYNAMFAAGVIGTKPLIYQWRKDRLPLSNNGTFSGSATPTLVVSNCQPNLDGNYDLVITNNYGSVTSAVAVLYVHGEPRVLTQPVSIYALPGGNARFGVSAAGTAPLYFQWCFNGAPLTDNGHFIGTATSALSIQNVGTNDAGPFSVVISNAWGAVTSSVANLFIAAARYVNAGNPSPSPPYTSWATAATIIQNAIDAANVGDWIVVTNGTYNTGGRVVGTTDRKWNRVVVTNQVTVTSVNGPLVTKILGDVSPDVHTYGTRCVWLGSGATLSGFTIASGGNYYGLYSQNGYDIDGGGILGQSRSAVVTGCIITGNTGCWYGGGVDNATLINCLVTGNNAWQSSQAGIGGGAYNCTLVNCTVVGNAGELGSGGTAYSTCENCIVYDNPDSGNGGNYFYTSFADSCTTPDPGGVGNTTNDPAFVGYAGGDYRLQFNSPCINTGSNAFVTVSTDLDGGPRILDGVVDMGVYEYQHAPWFLVSPTNLTVLAGSSFSLTVSVLGDPPAYQWWFNGAPLTDGGRIVGSGSNSLTVSLSQTNDSGSYWVTASNSFGMATSAVATVAVLLPVTITSPPTNLTALTGNTATFTVGAIGFAPPVYLWYSNGVALANGGRISGATSATLAIANVQTNDSGAAYQVVITNNYGAITSSLATLTVLAPVQITGQPMSQAILLGSNATFAVIASGSGPLNFQWYFNGAPLSDGGRISGSGTPALNILNVQPGDAGGYKAVVTNLASTAVSRTASLTPQSSFASSMRYVALTSANPLSPYLDWSTAATNIQDAIDASIAGDLVVVSNGVYSVGGRAVYGVATNRVTIDRAITVQSLNGPSSTVIKGDYTAPTHGGPNVRCAYLTNGAALIGFMLTNGGTVFSTNIVLEASGGGVWCEPSGGVVSNCVFAANIAARFGGGAFRGTLFNCILTNNVASQGGGACSNALFNCILAKNSASFQDLNTGGGAIYCTLSNCLLVANTCVGGGGGAAVSTLSGCMLSNNAANYGGGVFVGVVNNCLISSNRAFVYGGGAYSSALNNCVLKTNLAARSGGGAYNSALTNCTVVGNNGAGVGGVDGGAVANSIVYDNIGGNVANTKSVFYTCAIPNVGTGDFTNAPLFVNEAAGDFHLQTNSPCINSGNNAYVAFTNDFDGNPRIRGGTVDIGAYEFQSPSSVISYAYLQQYGLPTDGSADNLDTDGDGFKNWQEWRANTNPTNASSALKMLSVTNANPAGLWISWQTSDRTYFVQRSTNLAAQAAFLTIASNIVVSGPGPGMIWFADPTATNAVPYYYRVGVQ